MDWYDATRSARDIPSGRNDGRCLCHRLLLVGPRSETLLRIGLGRASGEGARPNWLRLGGLARRTSVVVRMGERHERFDLAPRVLHVRLEVRAKTARLSTRSADLQVCTAG